MHRGANRVEDHEQLLDWLLERALEPWSIPELQRELVERLGAIGIPLLRMSIGIPILHPLYAVGAYTWWAGGDVETDLYAREETQHELWQRSPLRPIYESGALEGRVRLDGAEHLHYPMLRDAAANGATDYFVQLTGFPDRAVAPEFQEGVVLSWIATIPGGLGDDDLWLLRKLRAPLTLALRKLTDRRLVEDVLDAYLGAYSGRRVLSGQIQRGDGELIEAVVFFCDLRGSSTLAEGHDYQGFLEILNEYFGLTVSPVVERGGEVLRFIGDASLAIFPIERFGDIRSACDAALDAALEAVRRGEAHNAGRRREGEAPIEFGIGLHPGTVMYGNIGIPSRLEFTVIGRAANEAARIESQCRELGEPILVSRDFARHLPGPWRSHGRLELRNIADPIEICSPVTGTGSHPAS